MTQELQQKLEHRFQDFSKTLTSDQWTDSNYLFDKVKSLEVDDIALAYRLMQRVKTLEPNELNQNYLKELQTKVLSEQPELAVISSDEVRLGAIQKGQELVAGIKQKINHPVITRYRKPFVILVWLPFLLFSMYQVMFASPRYESQAKIIVKEPSGMETLDPTMAVMSGFGISSGGGDTEIVKAFIYSNDMFNYLQENLKLVQHFSDTKYDVFSRLSEEASREQQLKYFLNHVFVEIDEKSQVIDLKVQAFEPSYAQELNLAIVKRAEWYINEIGHNLSKAQLKFVQQEHEIVQQKLQKAKSDLLTFQRQYDLLDPEAEGMALQQITYKLESEIAAKKSELSALRSSMSNDAPMVLQAQAQVDSLIKQLSSQRGRLTDQKNRASQTSTNISGDLSVGEILARYSDFKINLELALQAYTSSQVSLEKSRIEAYRQLKFLVVVESSTLPDDATYPKVIYNVALFLCVLLMLFGIGKIILATVEELR